MDSLITDGPWIIWILAIAVSFALLEGFALKHPERENTLSHFIAYIGAKFPFSIALVSGLFFSLLVHFYWHFCPTFGG